MKPIIVVSFSGGRTSAYMTKFIIDTYGKTHRIIVVFANTGQEHEETLQFIKNCDDIFGFNTVWLESVINHGSRKGASHKIVNFETACRDGYLFEEMIIKYGISNKSYPHCTRELKLNPIYSYLKSLKLRNKDYSMAIGIRSDETRRVNKKATKINIVYPLVDLGVDKQDVLTWWESQVFDLNILEHQGNCKWCWKKSDKKHMLNISENPQWYYFPMLMELKYPNTGNHRDKSTIRRFFRGDKSTIDLFNQYELLKDNLLPVSNEETGSCSESCELFSLDNVANNTDT